MTERITVMAGMMSGFQSRAKHLCDENMCTRIYSMGENSGWSGQA